MATDEARTLNGRLAGRVVLLGDSDWNLARQPSNLAARPRPAAVALPQSVDDIRALVDLACGYRLRIAPQGTGHGALSLGRCKTRSCCARKDRRIQIHIPTRSAWVQAGALWGDVAAAAAGHGLAGLAESSPGVGVVGYAAAWAG